MECAILAWTAKNDSRVHPWLSYKPSSGFPFHSPVKPAQDLQEKYDAAQFAKQHIDAVKKDRFLEETLQAGCRC